MSEIVRQSTARTVMIGPVLDATGGPVTDCVIGDFKLSKNGAAPAALNGSATATHRHTGMYSLAATTSDLDTVGTATITIDDTVNGMTPHDLTVIEEAVYDRDYAANATGDSSGVTTLLSRLSSARAGYLDILNTTALATQADINALNQSASRRVILTTVQQYERPETGTTVYTVEARTYSDDGAPMDATGTPTLTATGATTGSLAANVGSITNPSTGVYRWSYTVEDDATLEPVRFDFSAVVDGDTIPMAVYTQVCDFVAATFTTADRALLEAIPTNAEFEARTLPSADYFDAATDSVTVSAGSITSIASAAATSVWSSGTRTLTSFGTLVADIWAYAISTGYSAARYLRIIGAASAGKVSGVADNEPVFRDLTDTVDQISGESDNDGNRTSVTHGS